ncbi:MAG: hypothetical protein J6T16_04650 [Opitutales bacterium]|nr:hypothetical protein [Opitutales bacterium]
MINFFKMKNEIPIFAIDFEGSKSIGIVEFGAVGILNGEIFFAKEALCAPEKDIDLKTQKITGIANELAAQNPPFEANYELFAQMRTRGIFAAHNFHTEDSLLRRYFPCPCRVKNFFTNQDTLSWGPWLDSRILARKLISSPSEKLSELAAALNLESELNFYAQKICTPARNKWHCALFDALASALIIKAALPHFADLAALAEFSSIENSGNSLFS